MLAHLPPALPETARRCAAWFRPRRVSAIVVASIFTLVAILIATQSKMGAQSALFSVSLHPSQAVEVERALTIWNEPFSVDAQHTQVFVNAMRQRDVLLRLTLAGLPHRYVPTTSDVLDQSQSAFLPQAIVDDRRRAGIEGDLVTSLRRIAGVADAAVVIAPAVEDAAVVIAPAVEDAFVDSESRTPASASVQLVMQPGAQLSAVQVGGLKRFVAASYPGLSAEHVVVVDGSGAMQGALATTDRAASREARLQSSIQSALDAVFGGGATVVRVSLRSTGEERRTQSTRVVPHGFLEAESGHERGNEKGRSFERERSRRHFAYDTIVEQRTTHADAVARITVAVFLDARKITLAQSRLIEDLVRAAAGADLSRGDVVTVKALSFRPSPPLSQLSPTRRARLRTFFLAAALAAGLMALGAFLLRPRFLTRVSAEDQAALSVRETLNNELPQTAAYVLQALPAGLRGRVLRAYATEQRERILRHLNGKAGG